MGTNLINLVEKVGLLDLNTQKFIPNSEILEKLVSSNSNLNY